MRGIPITGMTSLFGQSDKMIREQKRADPRVGLAGYGWAHDVFVSDHGVFTRSGSMRMEILLAG